MNDPPRLLDDPSTHDALLAGLEAGRAELPNEGQLDSLAAKLGPLLGPGGGGGGPPVDPSLPMKISGSLAAKALGGLALVAAGVTAAIIVATPTPPAETPPTPPRVPAPRPSEPPSPAIPMGVEAPENIPEGPPETSLSPTRPRARPVYEIDPSAELALIRRAQNALRNSPARAFEIATEHERRFGPGSLAQEREVVAIDALHQMGQDTVARARSERFRRTWPRSAHLRRIDVILGGAVDD